jgi:hypothetical protein
MLKLSDDVDPPNHIANDPVTELILHKTSISTELLFYHLNTNRLLSICIQTLLL